MTAGDDAGAAHRKGRNLIVLSDGTGNSSAKLFKTSVWRLYDALDLRSPGQLALYDDGVGTASFLPLALLGGAFGWGLKRNVLDLYAFLCRNYRASDQHPEDHDRIFAFGFSRGAFTARVLVALVAHQGLVDAEGRSNAEIQRLARWAYRRYRAVRYHNMNRGLVRLLRGVRDGVLEFFERLRRLPPYDSVPKRKPDVEFLGVWDTVAAYGLPIDELTRGWDYWVWPLTPPDQRLSARVKKACHALSLNDERQSFFPTLWDEREEAASEGSTHLDQERVSQVWFAGMHSDVGGGYPDDSLSLTPLCWMAEQAARRGLRFMPHLMQRDGGTIPDLWRDRSTPRAPMHDSRRGAAAYYRYHPRPLERLCRSADDRVRIARPKVHESVFERIADGVDGYAPFVLPKEYAVVASEGTILAGDAVAARAPGPAPNPYEHSTQAASRANEQEAAWNLVWHRRVAYFATLAVTSLLLLLPFLPFRSALLSSAPKPLVGLVSLAAEFLPGFASAWVEHYKQAPLQFAAGVLLVALLMGRSSALDQSISATMGAIWRRHGLAAEPIDLAPAPADWLYRLRTSAAYRAALRFFSFFLWPHLFGICMLILLVVVLPFRVALAIATAGGILCPLPEEDSAPLGVGDARTLAFETCAACGATGIRVEAGARYRVTIALPEGCAPCASGRFESDASRKAWRERGCWADADYCVDSLAGFESTRAPVFVLTVPLRRALGASWFVPVANVGRHFPERHPLSSADGVNEFTATRSGPLALFVNDAVVPWRWDDLYQNNTGRASVTVTRLQ